jgi:hypothetical protein
MAKRRYTSKCIKFSIHLDLPDGTHTVLEFTGKNVYTKERYIDVEDPKIQKLLEATEAFGEYFEKSSEFDWMEIEEKAKTKVIPEKIITTIEEETDTEEKQEPGDEELQPEKGKVKVFATGEQAKEWLNQKMKVPYKKLTNKAKMIEEGALLGYTIEFENN